MKHWNRIVVDISNLDPMPTTIELINLVSDLPLGLPQNTRVALVIHPEQAGYAEIAELVAQVGGVHLNRFLDTTAATDWVKETAPEATSVNN
jgi:hypothetical protein